MKDIWGKITNLHWRITPIIGKGNERNTVNNNNLNSSLIESIRYPIYNLATQIEEIQTSNLTNQ